MASSPDYTEMMAKLVALQDAQLQQTNTLINRFLDRDQQRQINPARFLVKQTEEDDVETFLLTFERTATREGWPQDQWTDLIAPFLSGTAQSAYLDLCQDSVVTYEGLKTEIHKRLGHTLISRAQHVQEWVFNPAEPPRAQMYELTRLTNRWLASKPATPGPIERVIMDRFLRALPYEAKKLACQSNPQSAEQLVALVEGHQAAQAVLRTSRSEKSETPRTPTPTAPPVRAPRRVAVEHPVLPAEVRRCYTCGDPGHLSWACPHRPDVSMPSASSDPNPRKPCGLLTVCWGQTADSTPVTPVKVNGRDASALLDSGSAVTLARPEYARGPLLPNKVAVTCIHGETRQYPTAHVEVQTTKGVFQGTVGLVPDLPVEILIGRDAALFPTLWRSLANRDGARSLPHVRKPRNSPPLCGFQEVDPDGSTDPLSDGAASAAAERAEEETPIAAPEERPPSPTPLSEEENNLIEMFPLGSDGPLMPTRLTGRFGAAQLEDPNLASALSQVAVVDGKPVNGVRPLTHPFFAIKNKLLYRVVMVAGEQLEQLLVPRPFFPSVLQLAHSHLLGAHLGVEKTLERVVARFYWPGVKKAVENYCRQCADCQMVAPRPQVRAPLIPLPIISTPFSRIAMDLVGPLPKSSSGFQYILVVLDYATRYPEAIPLRTMASKGIAKELVLMFTRIGIPEEILTDQGTPFMSKIMQDMCKLLRIKQLRTSVYHPQTDGLVERFNQTLKRMIKKVMELDGRNWDQLLPFLMFSIREVPQASTGFSPFELLYGRRPRGLLDLAKEAWEQQPSPHRTMIEHVEGLRDRMATLWPLVREHMAEAQTAQARVYNRGTQPREFQVGDKVLVLVPTVECKFLARWQGPYEVIERLGEVNYKVRRTGRRQETKIYHINLLKKWVAREALLSLSLPQKPQAKEAEAVPMGEQLTPRQKQDLTELLQEHRPVFATEPGYTNLIEHPILTMPGKKVKLRPYRVPEARKEAIKEEVKKMLEAGIIEESRSEWCSPIVLVPKPDGTVRFCNDFRQLNSISQFDAYPMPRVDELIERLGTARFISTLDLTKGYWQVPLTPEAKEKTAFATPDGLFQYRRLPFGLHGAPATFQRLMDRVLRPHQKYAAAYLDDIVIHGEEWGAHLAQLEAVFQALQEAGLTANPKKCRLGLRDANYLGFTIGRGCVKPQVGKVEAIYEWPRPQTKRQVRVFLGLASYYRRFVPHFSSLAGPLTELTRNQQPDRVKWTTEVERAFQALKDALCSDPVLVTPDFSLPMVLQTDASETGVGAVLAQLRGGEEHPITFISRKLLPREKNYSTVEKECLAIKWAVEKLKYYLLGRQFTLVTDHAPLVWMARNKDTNARVTRWFLALQPFSFTVTHRSGAAHGNADALSRRDALSCWTAPPSRSELRGGVCGARRAQGGQRRCGKVVEGHYVAPWHLVATERYVLPSPHTGRKPIYGDLIARWSTGVEEQAPAADSLMRTGKIKGGRRSFRGESCR